LRARLAGFRDGLSHLVPVNFRRGGEDQASNPFMVSGLEDVQSSTRIDQPAMIRIELRAGDADSRRQVGDVRTSTDGFFHRSLIEDAAMNVLDALHTRWSDIEDANFHLRKQLLTRSYQRRTDKSSSTCYQKAFHVVTLPPTQTKARKR